MKDGVALDHEVDASISLSVSATDRGDPGLSINKTVDFSVSDVNEFTPTVAPATFAVDENSRADAAVGNVNASDNDTSQTLAFSISAGNVDNAFQIDNSGRITVAPEAVLNYEVLSQYTLTVAVSDSGTPQKTSTETFVVEINNVNDAPTAVTLGDSDLREYISGLVIGTLGAVDEDEVDTHQFTVNDARFEVIDGSLKLMDDVYFDLDSESMVAVDVTSTDSGLPSESVTQTLELTVEANPFPWQNKLNALDADNDGHVSPIDSLVVINLLILPITPLLDSEKRLPRSRPFTSMAPYYDTNGDHYASPVDVLIVFNYLNDPFRLLGKNGGEGEGRKSAPLVFPTSQTLSPLRSPTLDVWKGNQFELLPVNTDTEELCLDWAGDLPRNAIAENRREASGNRAQALKVVAEELAAEDDIWDSLLHDLTQPIRK